MEFKEIIEAIEDVDTLRKICLLAERKAWENKIEYDFAEKEIKELKELNEKLQKLLEDEKWTTEEEQKTDTALM